MTQFALRRVRDGAIVLLIVLVAVFVLGHVVGDPARALLPDDATDEQVAVLAERLGTDRPVLEQVSDYFIGIFQGDFGESYRQRRPALEVVMDGLGATLLLAAAGIAIGGVLGCVGGLVAGTKPSSAIDRISNFLGVVAMSIPNFWLGLMAISFFAVRLGWVPTSGFFEWKAIILPAVTLGVVRGGRIYQVVRSATFDEMTKPYVTVVRSKGLPERALIWRHVMRNTGVTMSTTTGWEFVRMVGGGLFTVEIVFAWPGVGLTMIQAANVQDFPVLQAGTIVMGAFVVASNAVIDVGYRLFDKRVQAA